MYKSIFIFVLVIIMGCSQPTESIKVENASKISKEDVMKIIELTKKHFEYANQNNFEQYGDTMYPKPIKVEEGTPVFMILKDERIKKLELTKISFTVSDDVGRPRVIADVDWTDREMQIAYTPAPPNPVAVSRFATLG
jgi:hypothetical protein